MITRMKSGYLNSLSIIKISGDEAANFLQGQLTNDVNLLDQCWQYTGYCNPKGRLLALFRLWKINNHFFALLPNDLVEPITKRLRMYIMRSKVTIEIDENSEVTGHLNNEELTKQYPNLIKEINLLEDKNVTVTNGATLLKIGSRYILIKERENNSMPRTNDFADEWAYHNILSGIPEINSSNSELFIPQMINLDYLNGISFKKGCYTGQEIVARMHYLGNLKQRMFLCNIDINATNTNIQAGDKIFNINSPTKETTAEKNTETETRSNAGTIVAIIKDQALAVIKLSCTQETLYLQDNTSIKVSQPQPYEIITK